VTYGPPVPVSAAPSGSPRPRVLVADDDPMVRRMLRGVLESAEMDVAAEAASGDEAVALTAELAPDLALLDVVMPGMDGIEAARRLHDEAPGTTVVLLTACDDDELGVLALRQGAMGYLTKDLGPEGLPRALRAALAGQPAVSRRLTLRLVEHLREMRPDTRGMRPVRSTLTAREWEVLDLLCDGASTEELADALLLTTETVRSHIKATRRKLGVRSRKEAVEAAQRMRDAAAAGEAGVPCAA